MRNKEHLAVKKIWQSLVDRELYSRGYESFRQFFLGVVDGSSICLCFMNDLKNQKSIALISERSTTVSLIRKQKSVLEREK